LSAAVWLTTGCNNEAPETTTPVEASTIEYAYTTDHPGDYWEPGDQQHAAMVLKSLKAFETGNIEESLKYFADTVMWSMDYLDTRLPKDSLRALLTQFWSNTAGMSIQMEDWESVISKDKKYEWVSLWYMQKWTDKTGKTDSVFCMDDLRIENGKITELDEKIRHYPASKN